MLRMDEVETIVLAIIGQFSNLVDLGMTNQNGNDLIASTIREFGAVAVSAALGSRVDSNNEIVQEKLNEWWIESIPSSQIVSILGERDAFLDLGLTWEEVVNFVGDACDYAHEEVERLRDSVATTPDAQAGITEYWVEDHYAAWRNSFLSRVSEELANSVR